MNYTDPAHRPRPGRRPGANVTREAILAAARAKFGELGYDRTTIRAVAAEAGVDPALVSHFFGSKQELFLSVVALPFDPAVVLPRLVAGDPEGAGLRLARFVLGVLEDPEARARIVGMVRAAASEPAASEIVRGLITRQVIGPLAESLGAGDAELRASLVGSQIVGLVMARHVVGVEPLASRPAETLVQAIAPNLQRYLTGPLEGTA
jgi:AcrR family transcriptional regulator